MDPGAPDSGIPFDATTITALVDELRRLDGRLRVFGAALHRYQFAAPLPEADLVAFESQHDVSLPNDYRYFISHIGNGGAGPNYGVKPLEHATRACDPSQPFPSTGNLFENPIGTFDYCNIPGAIWLSDNGCGTTDNLIVNGAAYGCVWTVLDERDYCCATTFAEWYTRWVMSGINTIRREPLIRRIRKGMTLDAVRELLGTELVAHDPRRTLGEDYWLAFPDCNAYFKFSRTDRVLEIDHKSHIISPR